MCPCTSEYSAVARCSYLVTCHGQPRLTNDHRGLVKYLAHFAAAKVNQPRFLNITSSDNNYLPVLTH